jgi:HD-like signal output (HDOD) protein
VSAKEVTESVQEEPALASEILKRVNSAYYGLQEKVSSLHHAILYLGFNNVYQLILENSVKNILPQDESYEKIRLHSYMISLIASQISADCQKSKPLINGTVGILHDVGKIITLLLKRRYPNIKAMIDMLDASKIGSCLLRTWEFPENIIKIIEYQYDPEFSHPDNIADEYKYETSILYMAHICYDLLMGEETMSTIFIDDYMAVLGMKQKDYREFYQQKVFPVLVKNQKRLPDKICHLLQEQAAAVGVPRLRVS